MILDYSYARPDPAGMLAAGVTAVMRYLSPTAPKNLSPAERDGLLAAGLGIGLVWESSATRAGAGFLAGQVDGRYAETQADALGFPASCPIFYAVDFAATPAAVLPYFQGVQSVARRPVGVYGSASVVDGVPAPWKWQTVAWSSGRISPAAHLFQTTRTPPFPGTDVNDVRHSFPLWFQRGGVTTVSNVLPGAGTVVPLPNLTPPNLTPPSLTVPQEDDMMLIRASNGTVAMIGPKGPVFITPAQLQTWLDLGRTYEPGMGNMDPGPFQAVIDSFGGLANSDYAALSGQIAGLLSALRQAGGGSVDLAAVTAAAQAGAAAAVARLKLTVQ